MAGHNKWSKIKRKKEVTDGKKSQVFSRHAKLIAVASKAAGGDVTDPGLRSAIDNAKADQMPKDNIERAIAKGTDKDAASLESITYEFYGPGGLAFLVETLTDNRNRTAQEIKHLLSKRGFALGEPGSASWAFTKQGMEWVPNSPMELAESDEDSFDALMEELEDHDDVQDVYCNRA
ncbi:MAG: YebC/PmpR family DNA-binding transcriptional regulator [Patescibacteria group bacterium UBA2103]